MSPRPIDTRFDSEIHALIVRMPKLISLDILHVGSKQLLCMLNEHDRGDKIALLINTHTHNFESIECLKYCRELLSCNQQIKGGVSKVAFVQPRKYSEPEIVVPKKPILHSLRMPITG